MAISEFQKSVELNNDPYSIAMLGQAYARNGQGNETRKILARPNEEAKSRYVPSYALALNYLFLVKVDPLLDQLRGDPRFEALVQKIALGK